MANVGEKQIFMNKRTDRLKIDAELDELEREVAKRKSILSKIESRMLFLKEYENFSGFSEISELLNLKNVDINYGESEVRMVEGKLVEIETKEGETIKINFQLALEKIPKKLCFFLRDEVEKAKKQLNEEIEKKKDDLGKIPKQQW